MPRKGPVNPVAVQAVGELGEIRRSCGGYKSIVRVVANAVRSVHVRIAAQMIMGDWRKNWSLRNICHDQFLAFLAEGHAWVVETPEPDFVSLTASSALPTVTERRNMMCILKVWG